MASAVQIRLRLVPFASYTFSSSCSSFTFCRPIRNFGSLTAKKILRSNFVSASMSELDMTEDNIREVLTDARSELGQIFDVSAGMTGQVDLVDLDGPYVKLRLKGRFWHTRALVLARVGNYLKKRIPEILEVDIEDEKQLDDSPENF